MTRVAVSLDKLEQAVLYVSAGQDVDAEAYLCFATGVIHFHDGQGDGFEPLPEDVSDAEKYVPVPDEKQLGLGKSLAVEFAITALPDDEEEMRGMFRRKGAYRNFRSLLERRGVLGRWYEFEAAALAAALRRWCRAHGVEVSD